MGKNCRFFTFPPQLYITPLHSEYSLGSANLIDMRSTSSFSLVSTCPFSSASSHKSRKKLAASGSCLKIRSYFRLNFRFGTKAMVHPVNCGNPSFQCIQNHYLIHFHARRILTFFNIFVQFFKISNPVFFIHETPHAVIPYVDAIKKPDRTEGRDPSGFNRASKYPLLKKQRGQKVTVLQFFYSGVKTFLPS